MISGNGSHQQVMPNYMLGDKMNYKYQGRKTILSSTTRDGEASMSASIRSSKGFAEHMGCG